MDALILSCSTGGGHNAAGAAIKEELLARGHHVEMLDPYALISRKLAVKIGNAYVKLVQRAPRLFGVVYTLGGLVRNMPGKSPVYYANIRVAKRLEEYLKENHFDIIFMPHLFPAELVTCLKRQGVAVPLTVFVATDYVCIPFTEETDCDFYIIPGEMQAADFVKRRLPKEKLLPFGIPVSRAFDAKISKEEAKAALGLPLEKKYFLLTGGSIGAGNIRKAIRILHAYFRKEEPDGKLIVVCGSNKRLYRQLKFFYRDRIILLERTKQMALYMKASEIFISKPGGLSSTEAAVVGMPYIHITPIPGCESYNMRFFTKNGMSIGVKHMRLQLRRAVRKLQNEDAVLRMQEKQKHNVSVCARQRICDWAEELYGKSNHGAGDDV